MRALAAIRKAIVAAVVAGTASYASGSDWRVAVAVAVGAGFTTWAVPNADVPADPAP